MANVEQTVYLITEQQRDALISYLQERPYREVAFGIQFLTNAPTAVVNINTVDEPASEQNSQLEAPESSSLEAVAELVPVLSAGEKL